MSDEREINSIVKSEKETTERMQPGMSLVDLLQDSGKLSIANMDTSSSQVDDGLSLLSSNSEQQSGRAQNSIWGGPDGTWDCVPKPNFRTERREILDVGIQAAQLAEKLEKNPNLKDADEVLKKMTPEKAEKFIEKVNKYLAEDGSTLHLDLKSQMGLHSYWSSIWEEQLTLTDNGKVVSEDQWTTSTHRNPQPFYTVDQNPTEIPETRLTEDGKRMDNIFQNSTKNLQSLNDDSSMDEAQNSEMEMSRSHKGGVDIVVGSDGKVHVGIPVGGTHIDAKTGKVINGGVSL